MSPTIKFLLTGLADDLVHDYPDRFDRIEAMIVLSVSVRTPAFLKADKATARIAGRFNRRLAGCVHYDHRQPVRDMISACLNQLVSLGLAKLS